MKITLELRSAMTALAKVEAMHTDEFISTLLVMLLKMNGEEVKQYGTDFANWQKSGMAFAKEFGFQRDYVKAVNVYLNGKMDEESFIQLGRDIKAKAKDIQKDLSITPEQFTLLKNTYSNILRPSATTWNAIHRDVDILDSPKLSASFTADDEEGGAVLKKAGPDSIDIKKAITVTKNIVKLAGGTGCFANEDQLKDLRENKTAEFSKYSAAIKPIKMLAEKTLFNLVRASGEKLILIDEARKAMDAKGINHNLPDGLTGGYIDAKGISYTSEKKQIAPVMQGKVMMNPKYDAKLDNTYVASGLVTSIRKRYATVELAKKSKDATFSAVHAFLDDEKTYRDKWLQDVLIAKPSSKAERRDQVLSTIVELIYLTNSRIGGKNNKTKGEPTYGMSTLQVQHLKLKPEEISYNYTGKKGAAQIARVKVNNAATKQIYKTLVTLVANKNPTDLVFTIDKKPVNAEAVNSYIRGASVGLPKEFTVHRFRNAAGTKAAMEFIKRSPFKKSTNPSQTQVTSWFMEEATKIGEMLMHRNGEEFTGMTSIKSYIDPQVIVEFFQSLDLHPPKKMGIKIDKK